MNHNEHHGNHPRVHTGTRTMSNILQTWAKKDIMRKFSGKNHWKPLPGFTFSKCLNESQEKYSFDYEGTKKYEFFCIWAMQQDLRTGKSTLPRQSPPMGQNTPPELKQVAKEECVKIPVQSCKTLTFIYIASAWCRHKQFRGIFLIHNATLNNCVS